MMEGDHPAKSSDQMSSAEELLRQRVLGGGEHAKALAEKFGMPIYNSLADLQLTREQYKKVPYAFAKKNVVLPIKEEQGTILVAVADPLNLEPLEELRLMLDCDIKAVYSPKEIILSAINDCYNQELGAASQLIANMADRSDEGKGDGELEVYDLLDDRFAQAPIIKLLNLIITEAIQQGASDIPFRFQ